MSRMNSLEKLLIALLFVAVLGTLALSQRDVFDRRNALVTHDRIFLLPRKEVLEVLSLGHEKTVADLLWIRAVQFFGGNYTTLTRAGFEYKGEGIRNLFYIVQYLDPKFYQVYPFGAFVFTEGLNDPKEAIAFLKRGSEVFPEDWELLFQAAFTAFYYLKDNEVALEMAERAGERPGVPAHVKRFRGQILSRLGQYEASIEYFQRLIEESQSEIQQRIARQNRDRTIRERNLFILTQKVQEYREQFGEPPGELEDLVRRGLLRALPADPEEGESYYYNPLTEEVVAYNEALGKQQQLLQGLQTLVERFYEENGYYPEELQELISAGVLTQIPPDPLGGAFSIDPLTHQVYVIPPE